MNFTWAWSFKIAWLCFHYCRYYSMCFDEQFDGRCFSRLFDKSVHLYALPWAVCLLLCAVRIFMPCAVARLTFWLVALALKICALEYTTMRDAFIRREKIVMLEEARELFWGIAILMLTFTWDMTRSKFT